MAHSIFDDNFIPGFCFSVWQRMIMCLKQMKLKFKPRLTTSNHNLFMDYVLLLVCYNNHFYYLVSLYLDKCPSRYKVASYDGVQQGGTSHTFLHLTLEKTTYHLLTESEVITGKYQTVMSISQG